MYEQSSTVHVLLFDDTCCDTFSKALRGGGGGMGAPC